MIRITSIAPLLLTAAILLAGNGIQTTLLAVRAASEGFGTTFVGAMGTTYFLGFMVGTVAATRMIHHVGHIRVFASLAAVATAGALLLVIFVQPLAWLALRFAMGFCFSGLFTVVESWLNETAQNNDRGRVLSIYRLVDLAAVTGSQLVLPLIGIEGFEPFAFMAVLFCLSLVPIALSDRGQPKPPESFKFDLALVWRVSPLASIGCITIGMTTSAFRAVGPVYAGQIGLDVTGVSYFITAGILGGAALQLPLGWLSDRYSRRGVLLAATLGASVSGYLLSRVGASEANLVYAGAFLFGAFALPLYSLSIAHANDHAKAGQYATMSAGLIFIYAIGASIGPLLASITMERFGAPALFVFTSAAHLSLVLVALVRMLARPGVPRELRTPYVALMRTSPAIFRLARRKQPRKGSPSPRASQKRMTAGNRRHGRDRARE